MQKWETIIWCCGFYIKLDAKDKSDSSSYFTSEFGSLPEVHTIVASIKTETVKKAFSSFSSISYTQRPNLMYRTMSGIPLICHLAFQVMVHRTVRWANRFIKVEHYSERGYQADREMSQMLCFEQWICSGGETLCSWHRFIPWIQMASFLSEPQPHNICLKC